MEEKKKSRGAGNQQVGRAGEYFVVAELNKRGAFAVPFAGNMPKIDLIACNHDESRTVHIQVKTKRGGKTWHFINKNTDFIQFCLSFSFTHRVSAGTSVRVSAASADLTS